MHRQRGWRCCGIWVGRVQAWGGANVLLAAGPRPQMAVGGWLRGSCRPLPLLLLRRRLQRWRRQWLLLRRWRRWLLLLQRRRCLLLLLPGCVIGGGHGHCCLLRGLQAGEVMGGWWLVGRRCWHCGAQLLGLQASVVLGDVCRLLLALGAGGAGLLAAQGRARWRRVGSSGMQLALLAQALLPAAAAQNAHGRMLACK